MSERNRHSLGVRCMVFFQHSLVVGLHSPPSDYLLMRFESFYRQGRLYLTPDQPEVLAFSWFDQYPVGD